MEAVGVQRPMECYDYDRSLLNNPEHIQAAIKGGATIVNETFHQSAPQGVSRSLFIAESHLSLCPYPARARLYSDPRVLPVATVATSGPSNLTWNRLSNPNTSQQRPPTRPDLAASLIYLSFLFQKK